MSIVHLHGVRIWKKNYLFLKQARKYLTVLYLVFIYYSYAQVERADALMNSGDYQGAIKVYKKMLLEDSLKGDKIKLYKNYNNIAGVYRSMGNYAVASDYYFKALRGAEQINYKMLIAAVNMNIAVNYMTMGKKNSAIDYVKKAKELYIEANRDSLVGQCYDILGSIYSDKKEFEQSLDYFKKSEEKLISAGDKGETANLYTNMAFMLADKKDFKLSLVYARKGLSIFNELQDRLGVAVSYINIQLAYTAQYNNGIGSGNRIHALKGISYLDSAHNAIQSFQSPEHLMHIFQNKYVLYKNYGSVDSAYRYFTKFVTLKDSLYNLENDARVEELRIQYEAEKKEQSILLLEKENTILSARNEKRTLYFIISIALIVFVLLIFFLVTRSRKKQQELENSRNRAVFELQALMAQMNPHFIFNALNSIQHYILEKSKQEAYDYLAKFSKLIRMVLNNSEEKIVLLEKELQMIRLYVDLEQMRFSNSFSFEISVDDNINPETTLIPTMLIQPYIENAIWHGLMKINGERKGALKVAISLVDQSMKVTIEDNGIGRKKASEFRNNEMHESLGMKLTEKRLLMINKMKGYEGTKVIMCDLYDEKGSAKGTRIEILIPFISE